MAARIFRVANKSILLSRSISNYVYSLKNARSLHMGEYFTRGSLHEIALQTAVPLAGRQYLVSSNSPGFPKYLSGPKEDFPMLVKARNGQEADIKHWALRCREVIDQAYQRYATNDNISEAKTVYIYQACFSMP